MTPLILLVGFLGAGKTTYLRKLLPELSGMGLDPHVVINDYQNAKVDAELLRELTKSIVPISGSCVCCGSRDELLEALTGFEAKPGRVLVVETNGTTDAEELVEWLSLEPGLAGFTLPMQVSLIDAKRWQKRFWHNALEREQVRTAGYFFVSRRDEIDARRAAVVDAGLAKWCGGAKEASPRELAEEIRRVEGEIQGESQRGVPKWRVVTGGSNHVHATSHFSSVQIELPGVVEREVLAEFLAGLPREVIRVKGLARLADSPDEYHVFQRVEDGAVQWLPIGKETRVETPVAVLIGPGVDVAAVRERAARAFGG
ncbi:MAG: GTP-binding protein [Chthoniobacterales bacterium]